ncbi:MAG TPA: excinuclease ABC subunit UvrC, partial [Sumerlaeia bacterium]|nr:excinuclease ABC subunit UvrC [Sumerlaeia bacterium]
PLIRQALHHIEIILTDTEKEAFLLENTLIKRHRPRYNVRLRDDKTYVSVRIDPDEPWPRATVTRARRRDKALYFGPYTQAASIRQTLNLLQKVFPLRSCSDSVFRNRARPCLLHQIGRCCAPCVRPVAPEEYAAHVRNTILFLKGQTAELAQALKDRMLRHGERMEFENAAVVRDQIRALEASSEKQRVASHTSGDRDVIGYAEAQGQAAVVMLFFRNGQLVESQNWVLPVYGQFAGKTLSQFLGQYHGEGRLVPAEIFLPAEAEDAATIEEWLGDLRGGRVRLVTPQRGEKRRLVEMANTNAAEALARKLSGKEEIESALGDLARRLHLEGPPRTIECYDIATLQGAMSAGSQVVFVDGEPHKAGYRLYKIRGVEGQDDYAMMREALTRRFRRAVERGTQALGGPPAGRADAPNRDLGDLPDLILVDGGKGQLSVAVEVLGDMGLADLAVAALAKSRLKPAGEKEAEKVRTPERLFLPGRKNPVIFPPRAPSFYLLQRVRDEAHRFVNAYHGKLRRKARLRTSLEDAPGIGARRSRALLRHFGSLARVREATAEALAEAPTMNARAAQALYLFFHADEKRDPAQECDARGVNVRNLPTDPGETGLEPPNGQEE